MGRACRIKWPILEALFLFLLGYLGYFLPKKVFLVLRNFVPKIVGLHRQQKFGDSPLPSALYCILYVLGQNLKSCPRVLKLGMRAFGRIIDNVLFGQLSVRSVF